MRPDLSPHATDGQWRRDRLAWYSLMTRTGSLCSSAAKTSARANWPFFTSTYRVGKGIVGGEGGREGGLIYAPTDHQPTDRPRSWRSQASLSVAPIGPGL